MTSTVLRSDAARKYLRSY